jgi:dienelactone hydrolase
MFEYFSENSYGWNQSIMIAMDGGGNINEIDSVCRDLKEKASLPGEEASGAWHDAWAELAGRVEALAARDEEAGNWLTAGRKYLRAGIYFFVAERHVANHDSRKLSTYTRALAAFNKGIRLQRDPVEFVEVPFRDTSLPALFVPAADGGRAPCMIHFDGFDITKEILYLNHVGQEYRRRGVALLIVDHPGVGEALRLRNLYLDPHTEASASACMDYLEKRSDVDPNRVGVIGASLGGYYAPRAAAFEKRLKCCIAWGAAWEFDVDRLAGKGEAEPVPSFQLRFVTGKNNIEEAVDIARKITLEGVADKITCPLLVLHGENDQIVPLWQAERTVEAAVNSPTRKLKVFRRSEGGAEHCQVDCITMGVDYAADWAAAVLGGNPRGSQGAG